MAQIDQFLKALVERGGSDLHLTTGAPPVVRVHGTLQRLSFRDLTPRDMEALVYEIMEEEARLRFQEETELDFAYQMDGGARFRVSAFGQRQGMGAVLRAVPTTPPTVDELDLPPAVRALCDRPEGLVLVAGHGGSGKSTVLAALVDRINETRAAHVLTVEDPVEFVHASKKCLVSQREVGTSARGFASAVHAALREDPDVIVVGELRDRDTLEATLTAASTGRLVLGTLAAPSAAGAVEHVVEAFPEERRGRIRGLLADTLAGVVAQVLLPAKEGEGRVAAQEVMLGTPAVAGRIRDGRLGQLPTLIQTGRTEGMHLLDQHLLELVMADRIAPEAARAAARNSVAFQRYVAAEPAAPRS